jgi:hypothetical protein
LLQGYSVGAVWGISIAVVLLGIAAGVTARHYLWEFVLNRFSNRFSFSQVPYHEFTALDNTGF